MVGMARPSVAPQRRKSSTSSNTGGTKKNENDPMGLVVVRKE